MHIFWLIVTGFFCCSAIATMTPIAPLMFTMHRIESAQSFFLSQYSNGLQSASQKRQIDSMTDNYLKKLGTDSDIFDSLLVSVCKSKECSLREYILLSSAHVKTASFKYPPDIYTAKGRFITRDQDGADVIALIKETLVIAKNKRVFYNISENVLTVKIQIDFDKEFRGYINSQIIKIKNGSLVVILKKNLIDKLNKTPISSFDDLSLSDIYIESVEAEIAPDNLDAPTRGGSMIFLSAADFKYSDEDSNQSYDQGEYSGNNYTPE